jgi:hypothetical protein
MSLIWDGVRVVMIIFSSLFKAGDAGHRIVFEEPSNFIQVHDATGRSLQVPLQRHS